MSDREAFIAALRDAPDDRDAHLVFSDWLEENGEPLLAQSIRLWTKEDWPLSWQSPWRSLFGSEEFFKRYRSVGFGSSGTGWFRHGLIHTIPNCEPQQWKMFGRDLCRIWPISRVVLQPTYGLWSLRSKHDSHRLQQMFGIPFDLHFYIDAKDPKWGNWLSYAMIVWATDKPILSRLEWEATNSSAS